MKKSTFVMIAALSGLGVAQQVFAAEANENWDKMCARCHAKDGSGDTKPGRKLKLKDYRSADVQAAMADDEMLKIITEGVTDESGKKSMPDYTEKLTEEERAALVPFVRSLKS